MQTQSALGELIALLLVIVIILGGIAMIVGDPSLMGRFYRWVFRVVLPRPLEWGLHQLGIALRAILRSTVWPRGSLRLGQVNHLTQFLL